MNLKWSIRIPRDYSLLNGCDPRVGFKAFQEVAGLLDNPPLVTVLFVSGVGRPGCLLEIDGITVIEDKD